MDSFVLELPEFRTEVEIHGGMDIPGIFSDPSDSIVVTDSTVAGLPGVSNALETSGMNTVVLQPGEEFKSLASIEIIAEAAVRGGIDRGGLVIGIGGGVICDMAAFTASIYMRGCRLHLVPTTLLSMVDASLGGKTGVDFMDRKNLIGTFYPAEKVSVFTGFLGSLSDREYRSGLAELIKHGFLTGGSILDIIRDSSDKVTGRDPELMKTVVADSLRVKAEYIRKDFRETGCRAHLNLGHTFGHALETAAGLGVVSHGEAVAWGMARAMRAGVLAGVTDPAYAESVENLLEDYGYDLDFSAYNRDLYMSALTSDKKKRNGEVRFVLQKEAGDTLMMPLEHGIIERVV